MCIEPADLLDDSPLPFVTEASPNDRPQAPSSFEFLIHRYEIFKINHDSSMF